MFEVAYYCRQKIGLRLAKYILDGGRPLDKRVKHEMMSMAS